MPCTCVFNIFFLHCHEYEHTLHKNRYILERIATEYPQSLYFSYRISSEDIPDRSCLGRLPGLLKNPLLENFVASLESLHSPHLWWNFHESPPIVRIKRCLASGHRSEALEILDTLERRTLDETSSQGRFLKRWAKVASSKMRRPLTKLRDAIKTKSCSRDSLKKLLQALCKSARNFGPRGNDQDLAKLGKDMGKYGYLRDRSAPVEWWSSWLSEFEGPSNDTRIEIPAQYDGRSRPNLESHATVESFGRDLKVMHSKQLPKRLLVRGSDRKNRLYLVKGGEDLRLDSRIEELFEVMNEIMSRDPSCSRRNLCIKTYKVIPMTSSVGLIEWVGNTSTFGSVLEEEWTNAAASMTSSSSSSRRSRSTWTRSHSPTQSTHSYHLPRHFLSYPPFAIIQLQCYARNTGTNQSSASTSISLYATKPAQDFDRFVRKKGGYFKMLSSASSKDTINAFTNCVKNTPRHLFRKRFLNMTSSAEAFLAVRDESLILITCIIILTLAHSNISTGTLKLSEKCCDDEHGGIRSWNR